MRVHNCTREIRKEDTTKYEQKYIIVVPDTEECKKSAKSLKSLKSLMQIFVESAESEESAKQNFKTAT